MVTTRELRAKAYELSAGVCRPDQADRLVNELERSGELVRLEQGMWTTRTLREVEQATISVAQDRATENAAPVSTQALEQAQREATKELHSPLSQEQRQALQTITGPGGVNVLVGRAGTGKGVVTRAATRSWQLEGNEVIGTAIAGATAKRLQADTGVDRSMTTDSLLNGIEKGHIRLEDSKTVVIMDKAGMADSDRLPRLVKLTAQRQSKLLLQATARNSHPSDPVNSSRSSRARSPPPSSPKCTEHATSGSARRGRRSARENPGEHSRAIKHTTGCTSPTPARKPCKQWSTAGTKAARPCQTARP